MARPRKTARNFPYLFLALLVCLAAGLMIAAPGAGQRGRAHAANPVPAAPHAASQAAPAGSSQALAEPTVPLSSIPAASAAPTPGAASGTNPFQANRASGPGSGQSSAAGSPPISALPQAAGPQEDPSAFLPAVTSAFPTPAPDEKVIYLTFDDGPDPRWTPQILDLLKKYNARASFFVLGHKAGKYPELIARIAAEGHAIANHGYSHTSLTAVSAEEFLSEVKSTEAAIRAALADAPSAASQVCRSLRPPYGELNVLLRSRAARLDYKLAYWGLDTLDWSASASASGILKAVMENLQPQRVILMHDGGGNRQTSVRGLELLLEALEKEGYAFKPLCGAAGQAIIWH